MLELILDIPVHREQNPALVSCFPPDDANVLATTLRAVWNEPAPFGMQITESACCAKDERRLEFAQKYQRIVLNVLKRHS